MGFDLNRFEGDVDEELICPICSQVLEEPVQAPECEHAFCSGCINQWLAHQPVCPIDRTCIQPKELKPVPRILKNLLSKLRLRCDHAAHGCSSIVRLETLASHVHDCEFNPKRPVACTAGCSLIVAKDELHTHNCVRELRRLVDVQQSRIDNLTSEVARQRMDLEIYGSELRILKSYAHKHFKSYPQSHQPSQHQLSTLCNSNSSSNAMTSSHASAAIETSSPQQATSLSTVAASLANLNVTDEDEIARWSATLPVARVTRWGGIISTPDAVLQAVIKRALIDTNCPANILSDLMSNAHERSWPPGLNTLEARQVNRALYSNFVCKRVPNKQAVLILACDNRHMSNHMIVEPGAILIFAHGVE